MVVSSVTGDVMVFDDDQQEPFVDPRDRLLLPAFAVDTLTSGPHLRPPFLSETALEFCRHFADKLPGTARDKTTPQIQIFPEDIYEQVHRQIGLDSLTPKSPSLSLGTTTQPPYLRS